MLIKRWDKVREIGHWLTKALRDETAGEVLEYALIAGLIVIAAIATIKAIGTKVLARWNSLNSSL